MSFSQPQAASAAAAPTRRLRWLGSTALLASLAITVAPSEAWAACSGINTDTTVCDAANPSGGSLDTTTNSPGATVDINAGAGVNTGVALGAAAHVVVQDDLIFTLTDPAGISSTVANSNAIFLEANIPPTGKITYIGSSNVTSAATGIKVQAGAGGAAVTQSAGVVTGIGNAIEVYFLTASGGAVAIDTVGSQIRGNISAMGNGTITITTGAVSGGIVVDEFGASGMGAVLITTNGAITSLSGKAVDVHSMSLSPITGSITLIANAAITGAIDLTQTRASATAPVTLTLNQNVTSDITVANAGSGATNVSTQAIAGTLNVASSGDLRTNVNGNISAVNAAAGAFGALMSGPGDMNVAINGAISSASTDVAAANAVGAFISSAGTSASGLARVFNASGPITAVATSTGAAGTATVIGGGASSSGSASLEATFAGAVSATAIASGAGAAANATGIRTGVGGGAGDVNLLLNGPVTSTASANNAGTATAYGILALLQGGGSGNLNFTANDTVSARATEGTGTASGIMALDFNVTPSTTAMNFIARKDVSAVGSMSATGIAVLQGASGLGGISMDVMGSVSATATAANGVANGIFASITNAANGSALAIRVGGDVIASGQGSGISASSAGTGDIAIDVAGAVRSTGTGISASRTAAGNILVNADSITGSTGVTTSGGTATVVIGSSVTGTGGIAVQLGGTNDILRLLSTSVTGSLVGSGTSALQLGGANSAMLNSTLGGFTSVTSLAGSNWSLNAGFSFAGPIDVGGMLAVNGLIPASALTVGAGGTLGGNGTVGNTLINGGTLSPGNSIGLLNVNGSLTFTAAATYLVQISGTTSDRTNVTGTATLAGRVAVDPLARLNQTTTYTIINAGTLSGTFDTTTLTNNFARNARLSYVGNDVLLTLDPGLLSPILPGNASGNQKNVAAAIDNALTGGATLPAGFNGLFLLSGDGLLKALTQASGETTTGSQQTTFDAMNLFVGLLTDPFTAGRGFEAPGAMGYASMDPRNAHAMFTKAMPRAPAFEARWNVRAAGYGGSRSTDGNAVAGSNNTTASIGGIAVGADVWLSPNTVAGFALAGGGTSFSVAGGGSGRSDLFQAGAFVRHNVASAYITAAAAYGWQDITTERTVTIAGIDRLSARYNANSYSGRVEAGNRYLLPWINGIDMTPYAAVQVTALDLPGYAETVNGGINTFALNYTSKTVTAPRSEHGLRSDKSFAVNDVTLTLRGRAAWAHDYSTDRSAQATFQTLPGASFSVSGAAAARDTALTTASAEIMFSSGISLATTFEGEFSGNTRSYAGKGVARYAW